MKWKNIFIYILLAISSFHLAYLVPILAPLMLLYFFCLYKLSELETIKSAFFAGLFIGMSTISPHLIFFFTIFNLFGLVLWFILSVWIGLFLVAAQGLRQRFKYGEFIVPVLWLGLEFFRSELYFLRFSWMSPGFSFNHHIYSPLLVLGVYGISLVFFYIIILADKKLWKSLINYIACISLIVFGLNTDNKENIKTGPKTLFLQYEYPKLPTLILHLNKILDENEDVELIVLSEYTFNGLIPDLIYQWCEVNDIYLIIGAKDMSLEDNFYNTAFVIGPDGKICHKQVKSVPIQFFNDGVAAKEQKVWDSPWGKIGLAICYDFSYSFVIDGLVEQGAETLIIPTMDAEYWGAHQHWCASFGLRCR